MLAALLKSTDPANLSRAEVLRFHALSAGLALTALLLTPGWAFAHPHVFVDAETTIAFDNTGNVIAIEHRWSFDRAISAWQIQGLDTNGDGKVRGDELSDLTRDSMADLARREFYTYAGEGATDLHFEIGPDSRMSYVGGRTVLEFSLVPTQAYRIGKELEIAVYDPEYYVALGLDDIAAVTLRNAPADCSASLRPARQLPPELADQLNALPAEVTELPPELGAVLRGMQGAILIRCEEGEALPPGGQSTDFDNAPPGLPFGRPAHQPVHPAP